MRVWGTAKEPNAWICKTNGIFGKLICMQVSAPEGVRTLFQMF